MCEWNNVDGERRNVRKLQRDECHRSSQIDVHQSAKSLAHAKCLNIKIIRVHELLNSTEG